MYDKKELWAEAFLRGYFVARMRTTHHCESINSALKKVLMATYPLKDFVEEIDLALSKMWHNKLQRDYTSKYTYSEPPSPTDFMRPFYEPVVEIYIRQMYFKVVEQVSKENAYLVTHHADHEDHFLYTLKKFRQGEI